MQSIPFSGQSTFNASCPPSSPAVVKSVFSIGSDIVMSEKSLLMQRSLSKISEKKQSITDKRWAESCQKIGIDKSSVQGDLGYEAAVELYYEAKFSGLSDVDRNWKLACLRCGQEGCVRKTDDIYPKVRQEFEWLQKSQREKSGFDSELWQRSCVFNGIPSGEFVSKSHPKYMKVLESYRNKMESVL